MSNSYSKQLRWSLNEGDLFKQIIVSTSVAVFSSCASYLSL